MIAHKRLPPLGRRSPPPRHVLGHTRLSDINAELEQFAVDPSCSPQRVGKAHVADQLTDLQRHFRPAARSRLPAPVRSEPHTMPQDHGLMIASAARTSGNHRQRLTNINRSVLQKGGPLWPRPPQNIDLLAQHQVLSFQRRSRSEQADQRPPDQPAKIPHRAAASTDSRSLRYPDEVCGRDREGAQAPQQVALHFMRKTKAGPRKDALRPRAR